MFKHIEELIATLDREFQVYTEVYSLSKVKRRAIIEGDIKTLDEITKKEQGIIYTLGNLEKARESIMNDVYEELQLKNIENIEELIKYLDKDTADKLMDIKEKLMGLLTSIKEENELNSKLIKQSLEFIDFNKNLIASIENMVPSYGIDGNEKKIQSNFFDAKV